MEWWVAMREKVGGHSCAVVGDHEGEGRRGPIAVEW